MSAHLFPHSLSADQPVQLGLVVLQADETIEPDMRRLFGREAEVLVTRIASGEEVTPETLAAMETHLGQSASLLPGGARFSALAYACTSGAAQIGPARVAEILRAETGVAQITDPVSALTAACSALGVTRLGLLSPYVAEVSDRIRTVLAEAGIATPVFGSFNVAEEARVVRIAPASIRDAAVSLAQEGGIEALFLSCTNLRTLDLIEELEARTGLPVLSSNQVLAWHLARCAEVHLAPGSWGRLASHSVSLRS
ncbi:aspartate/glutamate racemase family protein [Pseudooceanicola sp.]|uniref:maleate cis-trans isomerase family protein n=1 Tax=Pseudooceanicola sp. TaxID=1914328 RepID=UPI0035C70D2A